MAGLHSTGSVLWDRHCITTYTQANSCREEKLYLECVPRAEMKGNGAPETSDMVLCPAARMVHQGTWVG